MITLSRNARQPRHVALAGALLIGLSLVLMTMQSDGGSRLSGAATSVAAPITEAGSRVHEATSGVWSSVFSAGDLAAENDLLRAQLAELQAERAAANERAAEFEAAARVVHSLPEFAPRLCTASVTTRVPDARRHRIWVNRGLADGVRDGQTALGPEGIIGAVRETQENRALIELLTDERARWGGEVAERALEGIISGTGDDNRLEFRLETSAGEMAPGDVVRSSGLKGSAVPAGLPIGVVREVVSDKNGERHAVLDPVCRAGDLKYVYILDAQP